MPRRVGHSATTERMPSETLVTTIPQRAHRALLTPLNASSITPTLLRQMPLAHAPQMVSAVLVTKLSDAVDSYPPHGRLVAAVQVLACHLGVDVGHRGEDGVRMNSSHRDTSPAHNAHRRTVSPN